MAHVKDNLSPLGHLIERTLDILVSACSIVVFSPLAIYCIVRIKREDHGPAIFRQERIGRGGKPFDILKFRTMRLDAEDDGPQLCATDGDDQRLTQTGKFLRDHHLDELPQLWNVLVGEMTFIGPRPERKYFIDQIMEHDPRYESLYQVRPGVTSYATLYNGYTDTLEKMLRRLELDLYHLEHHSLVFDMKILWLTFAKIVSGKKF